MSCSGGRSARRNPGLHRGLFFTFLFSWLVPGLFFLVSAVHASEIVSSGTIGLVATVPLLPGYANLISENSKIETTDHMIQLSLVGPGGLPVRNREISWSLFYGGAKTPDLTLVSRTDSSGFAKIGRDEIPRLPGPWTIRAEAVFPDGRVGISGSKTIPISGSGTEIPIKGLSLLVLSGYGVYTGKESSSYGRKRVGPKQTDE